MSLESTESQKQQQEPMEQQSHLTEQDVPSQGVQGRLIAIAVYVALSIGLYFVLAPAMADQEQLQSQLEAAGVWGVIAYLVLYAAQMFVPWLPGAPLDIIGGATLLLVKLLKICG